MISKNIGNIEDLVTLSALYTSERPPSTMLAQHQTNIGFICHVCRARIKYIALAPSTLLVYTCYAVHWIIADIIKDVHGFSVIRK